MKLHPAARLVLTATLTAGALAVLDALGLVAGGALLTVAGVAAAVVIARKERP